MQLGKEKMARFSPSCAVVFPSWVTFISFDFWCLRYVSNHNSLCLLNINYEDK